MPRAFVTFESECNDDAQWDGDALAVPGGRLIMQLLRETLLQQCLQCTVPEPHSFYAGLSSLVLKDPNSSVSSSFQDLGC